MSASIKKALGCHNQPNNFCGGFVLCLNSFPQLQKFLHVMLHVDRENKVSGRACCPSPNVPRATAFLAKSTCLRSLFYKKKRPRSALLVGLDHAGKSSILCSLPQVRERLRMFAQQHNRDVLRIEPTTALQLVKFTMTRSMHHRCHRRANIYWHVWDMSGQGRYRPLWMYYCSLVQAIIFVVDISDVERIAVARNELWILFAHPAARGMPLLVLANKADVTGSHDPDTVDTALVSPNCRVVVSMAMLRRMLDLDSLQKKHQLDVNVVECSARTGRGIEPAFQWLTDHVIW